MLHHLASYSDVVRSCWLHARDEPREKGYSDVYRARLEGTARSVSAARRSAAASARSPGSASFAAAAAAWCGMSECA
jgi:hypothetical protein